MLYPVRVLLASCAVTMVAANCYNSGDEGNKQTALNGLDTACKAMQGYFAAKQERSKCVGSESESTFWFIGARNEGSGGTLDLDTCKERLKREIDGCSARGGARSEGDWWVRADPGLGHCSDLGYINDHPNGKREVESSVTVYSGNFNPSHEVLQMISSAHHAEKRGENAVQGRRVVGASFEA